jgi:hypothetical protein
MDVLVAIEMVGTDAARLDPLDLSRQFLPDLPEGFFAPPGANESPYSEETVPESAAGRIG